MAFSFFFLFHVLSMAQERECCTCRQEGMAHKVLQWYLCRMEGWFATDADNISVQSWDEVQYK